MNSLKRPHPHHAHSRASIIGFRDDIYRRVGNIRAVTFENGNGNADSIFGSERSFQGLFAESFDKTANDIEMDADTEMDELGNDAPSAFDRI